MASRGRRLAGYVTRPLLIQERRVSHPQKIPQDAGRFRVLGRPAAALGQARPYKAFQQIVPASDGHEVLHGHAQAGMVAFDLKINDSRCRDVRLDPGRGLRRGRLGDRDRDSTQQILAKHEFGHVFGASHAYDCTPYPHKGYHLMSFSPDPDVPASGRPGNWWEHFHVWHPLEATSAINAMYTTWHGKW